VRGLYNFGPDPRQPESSSSDPASSTSSALPAVAAPALREGRFSAGAELYYGILNKSGGASAGLRFATLPQHTGFPYTMTLTLNPLMGNLSASYAVRAGSALALCSRFNFNFYSYESDYQLGVELWRRKPHPVDELAWARKILREPNRGGWGELTDELTGDKHDLEARRESDVRFALSDAAGGIAGDAGFLVDELTIEEKRAADDLWVDNPNGFTNDETAGVLKARINQDGGVGLLWEGRLKDLLCSAGITIDFKKREQIFRGVGLEIQYSS
jgi:mitochondrial distribution and morphology protein 10